MDIFRQRREYVKRVCELRRMQNIELYVILIGQREMMMIARFNNSTL